MCMSFWLIFCKIQLLVSILLFKISKNDDFCLVMVSWISKNSKSSIMFDCLGLRGESAQKASALAVKLTA